MRWHSLMGEDSVRAVAPVVTVMVGGMATVVRMGVARVGVVEARVEVAMMVAVKREAIILHMVNLCRTGVKVI